MDLILASKSYARRSMLEQCGLNFTCLPADIDEASIIKKMIGDEEDSTAIVGELAYQKAKVIADQNSSSVVIGSDQILVFDNEIFQKAESKEEARNKLKRLRGKTHYLLSAYAVVKGDIVLDRMCESVALTMHDFSDEFLEKYLEEAGGALTQCVGSYALEQRGVTLFSKIEGDYFTILGMPLLPLLSVLRQQGIST